MVFWITGRASAGKSTIANKLMDFVRPFYGRKALKLDGDDVRLYCPVGLDFSDEGRERHIKTVAGFAKIAEGQGFIPLIALVSPKKIWRQEAIKANEFKECRMVYVEGGYLWEGTSYEEPDETEPVVARGTLGELISTIEKWIIK